MRVVVDESRCHGNALCMASVPEVFDVGDDGISRVIDARPSPELRDRVDLAVRRCPTQAISIEDD